MERTPPGDDKKPGEEPKDKELPLPQVAEGQVPAEQGGYRGYGTSPTQSESDLFAEYLNAVGAPSAPPAADVIEGWKLGLGKAEPALLQVLAHNSHHRSQLSPKVTPTLPNYRWLTAPFRFHSKYM